MSETTIGGDAAGPVLSGSFSGPAAVGGGAHITFQQLVQQEMQQELPVELRNATLRDMILGLGRGVQSLVERMEDHIDAETTERREKQAEHAELHRDVTRRLDRLELFQIVSLIGLFVLMVLFLVMR